MRSVLGRRAWLGAATVCAIAGIGASSAESASARSCPPLVKPYPGNRYKGTDLHGIRARGLSCEGARRVVLGAHSRALGQTPPPSGVRRFTWHGWRVTGDLRPDTDRYLATRGGRRVRWLF